MSHPDRFATPGGLSRNTVIVGSVVALHVAGLWALQSGLLRKAAEVIVPAELLTQLNALPAPPNGTPPPPRPSPPPGWLPALPPCPWPLPTLPRRPTPPRASPLPSHLRRPLRRPCPRLHLRQPPRLRP